MHPGILGQHLEAVGVLRPGELLAEGHEAEPVVDALVEDAARTGVPLYDEDITRPGPARRDGRGKAGRTTADDDDVMPFARDHLASPSLLGPVTSRVPAPSFVTSSMRSPSTSRARISMTLGVQKPP